MPRQITRTTPVTAWVPPTDPTRVGEVRVRVVTSTGAGETLPITDGRVVTQYWDSASSAYLAVVCVDEALHCEVSDLPEPIVVSRLVVHPSSLRIETTTYTEEQFDCPPCSDCGQPDSHGEGTRGDATVALCDECAIDLDVTLAPWSFVVEAAVAAEESNADLTPRRARQRAQRLAEITAPVQLADGREAGEVLHADQEWMPVDPDGLDFQPITASSAF